MRIKEVETLPSAVRAAAVYRWVFVSFFIVKHAQCAAPARQRAAVK